MRDREDEREREKSVRPSNSGCLTVEVKWLDSEEKKKRLKWEPVLEGEKSWKERSRDKERFSVAPWSQIISEHLGIIQKSH